MSNELKNTKLYKTDYLKNIHNYNSKCYKLTTVKFSKGLFDSCINMAYLITMENSSRQDEFMKQLKEHTPASTVMIQYNKGYRKCDKKINKNTSAYDLSDALRNIFTNALENNYKRILVFEDDFIMDKTKYSMKDVKRICKFINKNNPDVYNLGALIHFSLPTTEYHIKLLVHGISQSVIYNENYMKKYINAAAAGKIEHCDQFWNDPNISTYAYYKPITYQKFPATENMKQWGPTWRISQEWLRLWGLDKSHENYETHSRVSHWIPWIFIIIILILLILIPIFCIKPKRILAQSNFKK